MRICFITHKVRKGDGQGRVNYEVIREMLAQGHEVVVISSELSEELAAMDRVVWKKISVRRLPSELLRNQWFAIASALWLLFLGKRIDITVANGFITYARSNINCIHFVHRSWLNSKYHPFRERKSARSFYQYIFNFLNSFLEKFAVRRTDRIVAVSEQVKQELLDSVGIAEEHISVIRNGVDLREFYPRKVKRADYHLSEDKIYALFAGDIKSSRKNLDTVLKSVADVEDLHLLVIGSTKGSIYPQLAQSLGIADRVHFLGYRTDIAEMMSLADLFVYPSRYEPFALVLLEAMAVGLPIITSCNCGAVELLNNDAAIIIDDPNDREALTDAIKQCLSSRDRLIRMGNEAKRLAVHCSWSEMAGHYSRVIQETAVHKAVTATPR
ncbi:glycosyltransferase family 4 protein [Paenibacillus sp. NPDC058071]|uniref:glycosyltransferase family 4 protein n=1 Tax=Paenibacillus sp. NPDC058071 TaxID=3346326 RepID=UPI0036D8EE7C